jgi:hypothetical protein
MNLGSVRDQNFASGGSQLLDRCIAIEIVDSVRVVGHQEDACGALP